MLLKNRLKEVGCWWGLVDLFNVNDVVVRCGLCRQQIMGLDRRYLLMDGEDNRPVKHRLHDGGAACGRVMNEALEISGGAEPSDISRGW